MGTRSKFIRIKLPHLGTDLGFDSDSDQIRNLCVEFHFRILGRD